MRELFFQVVPIVLILLVFYAVLRVLFFAPLLKVMAEREARTAGAQKAAEAAQAAANEKVKQYQEALKQARAQVYAQQEAARKTALDERAEKLKDVRAKAAARVGAAKNRIDSEMKAVKSELPVTVNPLAAVVARRVLQASRPPAAPPKEAR